MYEIVEDRPTSGQFVEVWEYKGSIFSDTLWWSKDGGLVRYSTEYDEWNEPDDFHSEDCINIRYIVLGDK